MKRKMTALMLTAALLLTGCGSQTAAPEITSDAEISNAKQTDVTETTDTAAETTTAKTTTGTTQTGTAASTTPTKTQSDLPTLAPVIEDGKFAFNPHLCLPSLSEDIPQDYWESFFNLCDALRAGETTFTCSSEKAYKWATDPATLTELFPPACTKILGVSNDGTTPFENGVGRIYYQMPADEYVKRQAEFESLITDILNEHIQPDDSAFEICLKLFDYMSLNYVYQDEFVENKPEGAIYLAIKEQTGRCVELSSVYSYFLLQAGIEALQIGDNTNEMTHAWTYILLNGNGYFSDPTFALRSAFDPLDLQYFLMNDTRREESGCPVENLTAPLLPLYFVDRSSTKFPATDDTYNLPPFSYLGELDEANKTIYYTESGDPKMLHYAQN